MGKRKHAPPQSPVLKIPQMRMTTVLVIVTVMMTLRMKMTQVMKRTTRMMTPVKRKLIHLKKTRPKKRKSRREQRKGRGLPVRKPVFLPKKEKWSRYLQKR